MTYDPEPALPGAAERVGAFVQLAVASGVGRLVLLSCRNEEDAGSGERAVRESGTNWTLVRSSTFNQLFSAGFLLEQLLDGELALPVGDAAEPFVDADDIADVVVAALTDDRHAGQLYEVTGPRLLTFAEAVAEIAEATGRDLQYVPVTAEQFAATMAGAGHPPDAVRNYTELFSTILDGRNSYVADGVGSAPWAARRATSAPGHSMPPPTGCGRRPRRRSAAQSGRATRSPAIRMGGIRLGIREGSRPDPDLERFPPSFAPHRAGIAASELL